MINKWAGRLSWATGIAATPRIRKRSVKLPNSHNIMQLEVDAELGWFATERRSYSTSRRNPAADSLQMQRPPFHDETIS
jgi:hypothetical protein